MPRTTTPRHPPFVHKILPALVLLVGLGGCQKTPPAVAPAPMGAAPAEPPGAPVEPGDLTIAVLPVPAYLERSDAGQLLNCDFLLSNRSAAPLELVELQVSVYDAQGALEWRKFLNGSGMHPGIETIADRVVPARGSALIYNPLFEFPGDLELARLRFDFTMARGDDGPRAVFGVDVRPTHYAGLLPLRLPLHGRFIVWDGHDYYSHHRRVDYTLERVREIGLDSNAGRYSYDLIPVDASGAMVRGDEARNDNWLGFGAPIFAAAPGKVRATVDDQPDDRTIDLEAIKTNPFALYGNYIVVEHGPGEYAIYGHIRQGSAKVRAGQDVVREQELAAIGASGSSLMPHLHFQLQTAPDLRAEGLPSYFHDFQRVRGSRSLPVARGQIDSGDLLEFAASPAAPAGTRSR